MCGWADDVLGDIARDSTWHYMRDLELDIRPPAGLGSDPTTAKRTLLRHMEYPWNQELALNVVNYLLETLADADDAAQLNRLLQRGGSVWEAVSDASNERWMLARRSLAAVRDALIELENLSDRAADYLSTALTKLVRREPDPSGAYADAVKAVEFVACRTVTPSDPKPSLGKAIKAIRSAPAKWTFVS